MNLKIRRIISIIIDTSIIISILWCFSKIIEYFCTNETQILIAKLPLLIFGIYIILNKDSLIGYESVGKKIMNLNICQNGERVTDKRILVKRNKITFFKLPFCIFWICIKGVSDGDEKCGTEVKLSED